MNLSPITKKSLLFSFLFSTVIILILFCFQFFNKNTTIVFCDVGQGDGAYIRLKNKIDIVMDAGPANNMMLSCLGKYMPFYDRTIEYAILSHPQVDHYGGFMEILKRYKITTLYTLPIKGNGKTLSSFTSLLKKKHINTINPSSGDSLVLPYAQIAFLSPHTSNRRLYAKDENDLSVITEFTLPGLRIFFTGDVSWKVLNSLKIKKNNLKTILKVPHHGSKYGLSLRFLQLAEPTDAVISVGKNNSYGHPSKKALDLLKAQNIKIRGTDDEGDIIYRLN